MLNYEEFWQQAYLAAIRAGHMNVIATKLADQALNDYKSRSNEGFRR